MPLKYSSTRILHDDHMVTIALLTEVERMVLSRQAVPVQNSEETARLIDRLCKALEGEVSGHFDFEEASVFPVLAEFGMADLGDLLTEEHHALRNVMNDTVASGRAVRAGGFFTAATNTPIVSLFPGISRCRGLALNAPAPSWWTSTRKP